MVQKISALPACKGEVIRLDRTWDLVDRYGAPPAPLWHRIETLPRPKAAEEFFTRLKLWCPRNREEQCGMSCGPAKFAKIKALTIRPATAQPPSRWCRECGASFHPSRNDMVFCRPQCRRDSYKRRYKWGSLLYDLVIAWRVDRIVKGLSKTTQLADEISS